MGNNHAGRYRGWAASREPGGPPGRIQSKEELIRQFQEAVKNTEVLQGKKKPIRKKRKAAE